MTKKFNAKYIAINWTKLHKAIQIIAI